MLGETLRSCSEGRPQQSPCPLRVVTARFGGSSCVHTILQAWPFIGERSAHDVRCKFLKARCCGLRECLRREPNCL
jgi:hypothetical protein